jgi:hypothetical protein
VKIWGTQAHPRFSVTVHEGNTRAQIYDLIDLAMDAFADAAQQWAARRHAPVLHVPPRQEGE